MKKAYLHNIKYALDKGYRLCIKDGDEGEILAKTRSYKEAKEAIAQYIGTLPERDRLIISLYYYDQLTMKEIGRIIGLTEVRVCQIHAKVIQSLRQHLKKLNIIE